MSNTNPIPAWAGLTDEARAEARKIFLAEAQVSAASQPTAEPLPATPLTVETVRDGVNSHRGALVGALRGVREGVREVRDLVDKRLAEAIGEAKRWADEVEGRIPTAAPDAQAELLQQMSRLHPLIEQAELEARGGAAKAGQPNRR